MTNESHKHAGHSGNPSGAPDAETHFEYAFCLLRLLKQCISHKHVHVRSFIGHQRQLQPLCMCDCSVQVVSDAFTGKRLVQRHKMVYSILDHELKTGVHALALKTKTPEEVAQ